MKAWSVVVGGQLRWVGGDRSQTASAVLAGYRFKLNFYTAKTGLHFYRDTLALIDRCEPPHKTGEFLPEPLQPHVEGVQVPPGGFDSLSAFSFSGAQLRDSFLNHPRAVLQIYQFVHIAGRGGFQYVGFEIKALCPALRQQGEEAFELCLSLLQCQLCFCQLAAIRPAAFKHILVPIADNSAIFTR